MKNARFWLWGIIPLLVLWFAALHLSGPKINADLSARVAQELHAAGADWAKAEVLGRDVRIVSAAPDPAARAHAIATADRTLGVRRVGSDVDVLAEQSPFTWRAERKADTLTINGYAPSERVRQNVMAKIAEIFPGVQVDSKIEIAAGAPANFAQIVMFALQQLSRLAEGDASISDTSLAISGRASDLDSYHAIAAAIKALPGGLTIEAANVIPPKVSPYRWSATREAGALVLEGFAPDRQALEANAALARRLIGALALRDRQSLALGQSDLYPRAVQTILRALSQLKAGRGALEDKMITLSGTARNAAALNAVSDLIKAAEDAGLRVENGIVAPPAPPPEIKPQTPPAPASAGADQAARAPPAAPAEIVVTTPAPKSPVAEDCGAKVTGAIADRRVHFARSSAEIGSDSAALIDDIAAALKTCGDVSISLEGHTDNEGQAFNNQRLSEARAQAVRAALLARGIEPARVAATGFGAARPLVANTTKDNLAKNRRVEFVIR